MKLDRSWSQASWVRNIEKFAKNFWQPSKNSNKKKKEKKKKTRKIITNFLRIRKRNKQTQSM